MSVQKRPEFNKNLVLQIKFFYSCKIENIRYLKGGEQKGGNTLVFINVIYERLCVHFSKSVL